MLSVLILIAITAYLLYVFLKPKLPENFPPGPPNYPFVGGALYLSKLSKIGHVAFRKLGEKYGPVTGMYLGNVRAVVINGYEATKEFYAIDEYSARPNLFIVSYPWGGRLLGVFFSNGQLWQEQKRFTLRHLRDFGFGKTSMEGLIHEEAEECINSMKKAMKQSENSVIEIHDKFGVSMINILWAIMGGTRYSHDDENFKKLLQVIQTSFRAGSVTGGNLVNTYPFLRHFPYFKQEFEALTAGPAAIRKILEESIEEHKKTRDPASPRDLIDVYLQTMEEEKDKPNTTFFQDQLVQVCEDLFAAGAESTSNSVAFAVLHVLRNPEIQEKLHEELDNVVGRDRFPSFNDKDNLPYTFAVITESLRMSPVAPVAVPHLNTEDVKLMGYNIPKDTGALVNFTSTNKDPKYWGDPDTFRPERFIDGNGKFDKSKLDHVFGFGAGRRVCLGESLARLTNFLLFTAVMQRLKFELVPELPKPTDEPMDGFTVAPHPFSAKVTVRY